MENVKGFCNLNNNEMMVIDGGSITYVPLYGLYYDNPQKAATLSAKVLFSTGSGLSYGGPLGGVIGGIGSLAILGTADVIKGDAVIVQYGFLPIVR